MPLSSLRSRFPGLPVSASETDRIQYGRDLYPLTQIWMQHGKVGYRPDAVVWPSSTDEVAALVRWAAETGTPLIPYGAGSYYGYF